MGIASFLFFLTFSYADCEIDAKRISTPDVQPQLYQIKDSTTLYQPYTKGYQYLDSYQFWHKNRIKNLDPYKLIARQKKLYEDIGYHDYVSKYPDLLSFGKINSITCLDAYWMNEHLARGTSYETEFTAFILKKNKKLRVVFQSFGDISVTMGSPFMNHIAGEKERGWKVIYQIHNHPFMLNNSTGDVAGAVLPSSPDIQSFVHLHKSTDLKKLSITNGFSTYSLSAKALFQSRLLRP